MTLYSVADYYRRFGNLLSQAARCSETSVKTPEDSDLLQLRPWEPQVSLSSLSTPSVYVFRMILGVSDYFHKQR
jgi:hypothetical protein